jgi:hypothetical protein
MTDPVNINQVTKLNLGLQETDEVFITRGGSGPYRVPASSFPWQQKGDKGDPGWSWVPVLSLVTDGVRLVHRVVDWVGGAGEKPTALGYVGATGFVAAAADAVDLRGTAGVRGWSPVLAVVEDGVRRVQQVVDWAGGAGAKPATAGYVGAAGVVETAAEAVDVRGAQGSAGWSPVLAVVADGERRVHQVVDWTGGAGVKPQQLGYIGAVGMVDTPAEAVNVRGAVGVVSGETVRDALVAAPAAVRNEVGSLVSGYGKRLKRLICGDSFTAIATPGQVGGNLWWNQAQMQIGYSDNTMSALGGRTTAQIAAAVDVDAPIGTRFDEAWALVGQNDLASIASADAALLQFDLLLSKLKQRTNKIFISGPCNYVVSTTALRDSWLTYHAGLQARARAGAGFYLIPAHLAYVNPSDPNAGSAAEFTRTDEATRFHPSCLGALRLGTAWAYWYRKITGQSGSPAYASAASAADWRALVGANSRARNIWPNPTFTGSGGTSTGGTVTGTIPAGIGLTVPVGCACAVTIDTETVPFNSRRLKLSLTGTVAGTPPSAGAVNTAGLIVSKFCDLAANGVAPTQRFQAGALYEIVIRAGVLHAPAVEFASYNAAYQQLGYSVVGGMPIGAGSQIEAPVGKNAIESIELLPPSGTTQLLAGFGLSLGDGPVDMDFYIEAPTIAAW